MRLLMLLLCSLHPGSCCRRLVDRVLVFAAHAGSSGGNLKARGATVAFTAIKHQLRDWIESRLPALQWNDLQYLRITVLQEQLNAELTDANLLCNSPCNR